MRFHSAALNWFLGRQSSHMGPDQYVAHAGIRDGFPMSGDLLWSNSEKETVCDNGNMVSAETALLRHVASQIDKYIPLKTPLVELGPGTALAFHNKTMPIIDRLDVNSCILVDGSAAFLKRITLDEKIDSGLKIKPIIDNFFDNETAYTEYQSLICSFGSTISNFVGEISHAQPYRVLIQGLRNMAKSAAGGWLLIAFDSDHDAERIRAFYCRQKLFQLNIFDRMAVELPIEGDFDPRAFAYEPQWIASSGQLAHIALVERKMRFTIGGVEINLVKGQRLHIKNSYKYAPDFFEACCSQAGLSVVKAWHDESPAKVYLLRIMPQQDIGSAKIMHGQCEQFRAA